MCAELWAGPLRAARAKDNGLLGLHCHSWTRLAASATSATLFAPQKSQTSQASSRRTDRAEYGALNTAQSGFRIETRKLHHRCPAGYSRMVQHCIWVRMPPPTFESVVSPASKMAGSALLWYGDPPHSLAQYQCLHRNLERNTP